MGAVYQMPEKKVDEFTDPKTPYNADPTDRQGFIKLDRNILKNCVFDNEKLLKVWIWCLLKASHEPRKQKIGLQTVKLHPGQFVTGRNKASEELKMKPSTAWKYLKALESDQKLDIKSNSKFSVVTLVNWGFYQSEKYKDDSKRDNNVTAKEQQRDTNKNLKKGKNEKNIILSPDEAEFLETLHSVENYPADRKKDLDMYYRLQKRYPQIDLIESIKDWATYKLDKPLRPKDNPRSQINTSCQMHIKWSKNLKQQKPILDKTDSGKREVIRNGQRWEIET